MHVGSLEHDLLLGLGHTKPERQHSSNETGRKEICSGFHDFLPMTDVMLFGRLLLGRLLPAGQRRLCPPGRQDYKII